MKLSYHSDTDSLYIHLSETAGTEVVEIADGVVGDIDEHGNLVGIDIEARASEMVDLSRLDLDGVSLESLRLTGGPQDQRAAS